MATKAKRAIPEGLHTVTAGITVEGAAQAIEWYKKALGAEVRMLMQNEQHHVEHGEIKIGDTTLFINDPMMGGATAKSLGGTPVRLSIYVEDCDALFNRAVAAGAKVTMPMADMFWGDRWGNFTDPYGFEWSVASHKEDVTPEEMKHRREEFMKQWAAQQKKS